MIFWSYVITQGICNKFIEMKISVECMVWPWLRLLQDWQFGNWAGQFLSSIIEVFQIAQLSALVILVSVSLVRENLVELRENQKKQNPCLWDLLAAFLILCLSIAALTSENRLWANCSWVGGAKSTEFWGDFCN